jgi:SAM-dependent methyltransferase
MLMNRLVKRLDSVACRVLEPIYRSIEERSYSRGGSLTFIPRFSDRAGGLGTTTYGEWSYTIGLFQSLIFQNLPADRPIRMLDVGCGTGRVYLATLPYLTADDRYTGLDVNEKFLAICRKQYPDPRVDWYHLDTKNSFYAKGVKQSQAPWDFKDKSFNLVTAVSVWTHFSEDDWIYYLNEVSRVLKPGGRAIITFFILDEEYTKSLPKRNDDISKFYPQPKSKWIFDMPAYGSSDFLHPKNVSVPEVAIGVRESRFKVAVDEAGLVVKDYRPGCWKEQPGYIFQDVVVFERKLGIEDR